MQSDPLWFKAALLAHIAGGAAALLLIPIVLATTKAARGTGAGVRFISGR
jgi:hypothetical protein